MCHSCRSDSSPLEATGAALDCACIQEEDTGALFCVVDGVLKAVVTVIGMPFAAAFFAAAIAALEVTSTPSLLLLRNFFITRSPSSSAVGTVIESPKSPTARIGFGCIDKTNRLGPVDRLSYMQAADMIQRQTFHIMSRILCYNADRFCNKLHDNRLVQLLHSHNN